MRAQTAQSPSSISVGRTEIFLSRPCGPATLWSPTKGKLLQKVKPHAMTSLLLVPLDDTVVFPTMDVTLPVRVGDEERVLLVPRHEGEFAKVGTIAEVTDHIRLPGDGA